MYEPVKFKRLKEIVQELSTKLSKLHDGTLSKTDLESLTEESRELYERLVVLRFKAFQEEVSAENKPAQIAEDTKKEEPKEETPVPSISFRIDTLEKTEKGNQVSLIDAIEEVSKETDQPAQVEETVEVIATANSIRNNESSTLNDKMKQSASENFYDKLSKTIEQKETFNNKMEHTSITDLKRAISLNQRFQFSKELFKGNNQEYEVAIDKLNSTTREEAMKQIEGLRSKYQWNSASPIATDFMELVERRYL